MEKGVSSVVSTYSVVEREVEVGEETGKYIFTLSPTHTTKYSSSLVLIGPVVPPWGKR